MQVGRHSYGVDRICIWSYGSDAQLSIGAFCAIADNVQVYLGGSHRVDWVTTYPFGHINQDIFNNFDGKGHPSTKGDVRIENDVWIASNVTIMSGVTISSGAVIANNAHVVRDVAPYSIVGGNPAQLLRYRFDRETVARLLKVAWWDWPDEKINAHVKLLCNPDIEKFLEEAEKK